MASPYLNGGLPMANSINVLGSAARVLHPQTNSGLQQNLYQQPYLSHINPSLDLIKPMIHNIPNNTSSSSQIWMGKERDNTWLQLPVCPVFYRFYKEKEGEMSAIGALGNYNLKDPKLRNIESHLITIDQITSGMLLFRCNFPSVALSLHSVLSLFDKLISFDLSFGMTKRWQ